MTKLGFVRHGVTAWNKERRAQGMSDIPLDEEGVSEAERVAARLCTEDWDVVFSSDLLRARQTAEAIGERMGVHDIHLDRRLRERSAGKIEGMTETERIAKWGEDWREQDLGLETEEAVVTRGMDFLNEVVQEHAEKNILIVSHGAFIKYLIRVLAPASFQEQSLANTSVTCLVQKSDTWEMELFNCTKHMEMT